MNKKIRELLKQLEERGGSVHLSPQLPDALAESFLRQVLDCPDCGLPGESRVNARMSRGRDRRGH
jgi:hypothetical protein